jgi:hypothetical protein
MRAHIPAVALFVLFFAVGAAFPQVAAEAALLNGNSAAATAKAGNILGNSLNRASQDIAGKLQTIPRPNEVAHSSKRVTPSPGHPRSPAKATTSGASMITSIQGGHLTQPSPSPAPPPSN